MAEDFDVNGGKGEWGSAASLATVQDGQISTLVDARVGVQTTVETSHRGTGELQKAHFKGAGLWELVEMLVSKQPITRRRP